MSVIINECEIVVDSEQQKPGPDTSPQQEQEAPAAGMAPADIGDIVRHQVARSKRLWAH